MSRREELEGRAQWRSLEELAGTPGFEERLGREFPLHAASWDEGVSRRRFLELSGASLALAGLVACTRQPQEKIIPYVKQPEEILPGRPLWFATTFTLGGFASGLLVESNMGRPTKIEGNPDHPSSLGATTAFAQASVLSLYDPDRSQTITEFGRTRTWNAFLEALGAQMKPIRGLQGEGLRILTGAVTSPTLAGQMASLLAAMPKAKWHRWEAAGRDRVRAGARLVWEAPVEVRYDFSKADVVVTLDADPFVEGPGALAYAREFARRRRAAATDPGATPVRFYALETFPSTGGVLADHRLSLSPRDLPAAAAALAAGLGVGSVTAPAGLGGERAAFVAAAVEDLKKSAGRSLVFPGEYAPPGVHALAHAMNLLLGNVGSTVLTTDPVEAAPVDQLASIRDLAADLAAGKVELLVVLGANPVFDAPAELDFAAAIRKAAFRVHLGLHDDETAQYCQWNVNEAHPLETWSDGRGHDGTAAIQQPLVDPLYGGKSAHELLDALAVAGSETPVRSSAEIVKAAWQAARGAAGFDAFWRKSLHDGVVAGSAFAPRSVAARPDAGARAVEALGVRARSFSGAGSGVTLLLRPDQGLFDGRFANIGWLQELPRPQTKLVWDNAAHVSVRTAKALGLAQDDVVTLSADGRRIEAAVFVLPGHPDDTVTIHFGYGRTRAGRVGDATGVDVYPLRTSAALWEIWDAQVEKTGRSYHLVTTQQHFNMEGRNLARHGTFAEYRKDPGFVEAMNEPGYKPISLYTPYEYKTHAWGMSVNLSACIGCNACVVACQAENNIPVVGRDQVHRGREMQWIRIDRYYEGSPEDPTALNQPVFCMHCEKAPCEVVCPVAATTHSEEGLNEMTYNRCVGTRYCSNNCPYKVRRFNFYEFNEDKKLPSLTALANPNVTVRTLGVMEKCTYCVQRINRGRIAAEKENRKVRDGEIVTACQQVCPTEALVFGDINDPAAKVTGLKKEPLNYPLLETLNTLPRTTFLAKLSNPHPALAAGTGAPGEGKEGHG
jgi:MoCo/4Fe-4S cofactor protein with predicted Tat translocation signal